MLAAVMPAVRLIWIGFSCPENPLVWWVKQ